MCQRISFIYKFEFEKLELAFYDLGGHAETQAFHDTLTEAKGWYEGHYLPSEEIVCRIPSGTNKEAEAQLRHDYPTYKEFEVYAESQLGQSGAGTASGAGGR